MIGVSCLTAHYRSRLFSFAYMLLYANWIANVTFIISLVTMVIYAEESGYLLKQPSEGIIADQVEEVLEEDEVVNEPQKGLFCSVCRYFITGSDKKIVVNGSHLHTFANPQGIIFEVGAFSEAPGCGHVGLPTDKWSWFSGFSWQIVICRSCLTHLGWVYRSGYSVDDFYGLIVDRLVE